MVTHLTILVIPDKLEQSDESSSSARSGAAVDQQGSVWHLDESILRLVMEVQHQLGVGRHISVIPRLAVNVVQHFHFVYNFHKSQKI